MALSRLGDVCSLRTFLALGDLELNLITFLQTLVTLRSNRAVMNKDIRSIRAPDESVSFGVIEPLDGSFQTFHVPPFFRRPLSGGVKDEPAVIYDIFLRGQRTVKSLQRRAAAGSGRQRRAKGRQDRWASFP
jgi:hypothetical protein